MDFGNFAFRIIEVPDDDGPLGRTEARARLQALINTMGAKVTFLGAMRLWANEDCIVRAGRDTGLTANANIAVKIYDAV